MIKITKALAKKMYDNGEEVLILPDRTKVNSPMAVWMTRSPKAKADDFDKLCDVLFYYNCSPKAGTKLAFYAKEV